MDKYVLGAGAENSLNIENRLALATNVRTEGKEKNHTDFSEIFKDAKEEFTKKNVKNCLALLNEVTDVSKHDAYVAFFVEKLRQSNQIDTAMDFTNQIQNDFRRIGYIIDLIETCSEENNWKKIREIYNRVIQKDLLIQVMSSRNQELYKSFNKRIMQTNPETTKLQKAVNFFRKRI
jgi:phage-related protein